jgi:hypothetical protein
MNFPARAPSNRSIAVMLKHYYELVSFVELAIATVLENES